MMFPPARGNALRLPAAPAALGNAGTAGPIMERRILPALER